MKARVLAFFSNLKKTWAEFQEAWACPRRGLALRFVFVIMFFAVGAVSFVGLRLIRNTQTRLAKLEGNHGSHGAHKSEHASAESGDGEEHASAGGEHGDKSGGASPGIFVAPIPQSIEDRTDGVQEADKDLVEPDEAARGLANLSPTEAKVTPYNPFFKISGIVTTTADEGTQLARVAAVVTLEVDSSEAMLELEKKQGELKYMIASLISEQSSVTLRTPAGKDKLKTDVFKQINYQLQNGKIKDVLIEDLIIQ